MDDILNQDTVETDEVEEIEEMEELDDQYQEVEDETEEKEETEDDPDQDEEKEVEPDEITYLGEKIKLSDIPTQEKIELLQKGKNYDKINSRLTEQQRLERVKINTVEEKERLKDEPFFNDLYDEAVKLVNPDVNLTTAFYFIR